jgi:hypothetical protein
MRDWGGRNHEKHEIHERMLEHEKCKTALSGVALFLLAFFTMIPSTYSS